MHLNLEKSKKKNKEKLLVFVNKISGENKNEKNSGKII